MNTTTWRWKICAIIVVAIWCTILYAELSAEYRGQPIPIEVELKDSDIMKTDGAIVFGESEPEDYIEISGLWNGTGDYTLCVMLLNGSERCREFGNHTNYIEWVYEVLE